MQAVARAVPELVGGSGDLDPSTYHLAQRRRRLRVAAQVATLRAGARRRRLGLRRAQHPFRRARARHGRRGERARLPRWLRPVRGDVLHLLRLHAALVPPGRALRLHAIFVFTHDSIGVGEDGPTHEPIEQLASLRAIPNLLVIRPCDANETRWAWQMAVEQRGRPTALVLTRQHVPTLDRDLYAPAERSRRGAYVLNASDEQKVPDVDPDRERLGGCADRGGRAHPATRKREREARLDAVLASLRGADGGVSRERAAGGGDRPTRGGSGVATRLGTLDRPSRARSSASTASVPRRPARPCSKSTASRSIMWSIERSRS